MTIKENIRYLLRKNTHLKFNRTEFCWAYFQEFCDIKFGITKETWLEIYPQWQSIDRAIREILQEPEFKLPPEQDAKRYEKMSLFKEEIKKEL